MFRLYNKILDRLESDLGSASGLFITVITALWGARDGLSEQEMKYLFAAVIQFIFYLLSFLLKPVYRDTMNKHGNVFSKLFKDSL